MHRQPNRSEQHFAHALHGFPSATRRAPVRVRFSLEGYSFVLVVGDSHAAWWSHQDDAVTRESFEVLFAILADRPGEKELVADLVVVT